jgi:hypothetical protein
MLHKEEYNGLTLYFLTKDDKTYASCSQYSKKYGSQYWSAVFDDKVEAIRTFMTRALKQKRMKYHKLGRA